MVVVLSEDETHEEDTLNFFPFADWQVRKECSYAFTHLASLSLPP